MKKVTGILLSSILTIGLAIPEVQADPPPWAPAYGYRNKHHKHKDTRDRDYRDRNNRDRDYAETRYNHYGVIDGRCNRQEIGTVLGGAVGGAIGRNAADDKTLGTIAGIFVGAVLGNVIGRSMDDADRFCTSHALEYAEDHQTVSWGIAQSNIRYSVTPIRTYRSNNNYCREFTVVRKSSRGTTTERRRACRNDSGTWHLLR